MWPSLLRAEYLLDTTTFGRFRSAGNAGNTRSDEPSVTQVAYQYPPVVVNKVVDEYASRLNELTSKLNECRKRLDNMPFGLPVESSPMGLPVDAPMEPPVNETAILTALETLKTLAKAPQDITSHTLIQQISDEIENHNAPWSDLLDKLLELVTFTRLFKLKQKEQKRKTVGETAGAESETNGALMLLHSERKRWNELQGEIQDIKRDNPETVEGPYKSAIQPLLDIRPPKSLFEDTP